MASVVIAIQGLLLMPFSVFLGSSSLSVLLLSCTVCLGRFSCGLFRGAFFFSASFLRTCWFIVGS